MNTEQEQSFPHHRISGKASKALLVCLALALPASLFAVVSGTRLHIGSSNTISNSQGAGAIGYSNWQGSQARYSLAVGKTNTINYVNTITSDFAEHNFAVGFSNSLKYSNGLAAGYVNQILADNAAAIGRNLIADSPGGVVVGSYNDPDAYNDDAAFVVGIGTEGTGNDKNGLIVLKSGEVIVPEPQGDISMGIYGN